MPNTQSEQPTDIFKQTIALMIKYKVPPTPNNYSLWYAYVSEPGSDLASTMNNYIETQGFCSEAVCNTLYYQYLSSEEENNLHLAKSSMASMILELDSALKETITSTGDFQNTIDNSVSQLKRHNANGNSINELKAAVSSFISSSDQIQSSTQLFVDYLVHTEKEIKCLKVQLEKAQKEVNEDSLTGLWNRRAFDLDLRAAINDKQNVCLIMADIDHFKLLNDQYGHQLGDQVLKVVAQRIRQKCSRIAQVYRYGGEEFAIIVTGESFPVTRQLAEGIRRTIEKVSVLDKKQNRKIDHITASFGVAEQESQEPPLALVDRADQLLYQAKEVGRNRVMPVR